MKMLQLKSWPITLALSAFAIHMSAHAQNEIDVILGARTQVIDNFFYQNSAPQSVSMAILEPRIDFHRRGTALDTKFSAFAEATAHNLGRLDNYVDAGTTADFTFYSGLHSILIGGSFLKDHDDFGTERTEGTTAFNRPLDEWQQSTAKIGWRRNGEQRGDVFTELDVFFVNRDYTSNQDVTRFLERDGTTFSGLLGMNITSKTGLFVSGFHSDVQFDDESIGVIRSGTTTSLSAGVRWKASAKTSGEVRFGQARREQDITGDIRDLDYWKLIIRWQPTQIDTVVISTATLFDASYITDAEFFDTLTYGASWSRNWTRRLTTRMSSNFIERDFVRTLESDKSWQPAARMSYDFAHKFIGYISVAYNERESFSQTRDYERYLLQLGLSAKLN